MHVVATAGHVDHGKSTLVRALTGMEPDRWDEERRRGLTIDLGFCWTTLMTGEQIAFVDVPGHQRFVPNMLAGIGPVPAAMLVVAADEGWREQTTEHADALAALGVSHGLVAVTRSDLADPEAATAQLRARLAGTDLDGCEIIPVSGRTGEGLAELRAALRRVVAGLPVPRTDGRIRLWIDRSFSVKGAGTVVTGTLSAGTVAIGDRFVVGGREVVVRGVQSLDTPHDQVSAVARVALNLRGVGADEVGRGEALLTPGAWEGRGVVDVSSSRWRSLGERSGPFRELPTHAMVHVGTAAVEARVRPLAEGAVRLTLERPLPLQAGDRLLLRDPGRRAILGGADVLDVDPPALNRRGAARRRGKELAATGSVDVAGEVERRGHVALDDLARLTGVGDVSDALAGTGVRIAAGLAASEDRWSLWAAALRDVVVAYAAAHPLEARMPLAAARDAAVLPARDLVAALAVDAGLEVAAGYVQEIGAKPSLGRAEEAVRRLEADLAADPCAAWERHDLEAGRIGPREAAVAVRLGRLLDLGDLVLVAPSSPARAMRTLASLPQPFTTSQARQALGTTRRVVIPLLEHLDARGWTRRIDAGRREVVR